MKVNLFVALAAILIGGTVSAQHSGQKVAIGIKGGVNLTTIHINNSTSYDPKVGWNAGLLAHVHLVPHLALQPELVYSAQGAKFSNTSTTKTNINLGYINVPVLFQYMFDNGFRLEAGPQVGFLINAKTKTGSATAVDVKDNFKSADVGLVGGVSYVHPPSGFGVDLRYNLGLSNINENAAVKAMNRGGQLGVFYLINHKQK
ncbi:MAG: porin family protein [Ferruginibacter sp.]